MAARRSLFIQQEKLLLWPYKAAALLHNSGPAAGDRIAAIILLRPEESGYSSLFIGLISLLISVGTAQLTCQERPILLLVITAVGTTLT